MVLPPWALFANTHIGGEPLLACHQQGQFNLNVIFIDALVHHGQKIVIDDEVSEDIIHRPYLILLSLVPMCKQSSWWLLNAKEVLGIRDDRNVLDSAIINVDSG